MMSPKDAANRSGRIPTAPPFGSSDGGKPKRKKGVRSNRSTGSSSQNHQGPLHRHFHHPDDDGVVVVEDSTTSESPSSWDQSCYSSNDFTETDLTESSVSETSSMGWSSSNNSSWHWNSSSNHSLSSHSLLLNGSSHHTTISSNSSISTVGGGGSGAVVVVSGGGGTTGVGAGSCPVIQEAKSSLDETSHGSSTSSAATFPKPRSSSSSNNNKKQPAKINKSSSTRTTKPPTSISAASRDDRWGGSGVDSHPRISLASSSSRNNNNHTTKKKQKSQPRQEEHEELLEFAQQCRKEMEETQEQRRRQLSQHWHEESQLPESPNSLRHLPLHERQALRRARLQRAKIRAAAAAQQQQQQEETFHSNRGPSAPSLYRDDESTSTDSDAEHDSEDDDDDDDDFKLNNTDPVCPMDNATGDTDCDKDDGDHWGDPHLITFDGLKLDCQTLGDHIALRSKKTDFEFQVRYGKPYFRPQFLSWIIGIVIQEGTPGFPVVEISLDTPFDSQDGSVESTCDKTIIVDGVKVTGDITQPNATNSEYVWLREKWNSKGEHIITISYWSGLTVEVKDRHRSTFGCSITTAIRIPLYVRYDWDVYGLLGSPDGDKSNDWVKPDGSQMVIPGGGTRKVNGAEAAFYCRQWCLTDENDSMFSYNPSVSPHSFDEWQNCIVGPSSSQDHAGGDVDTEDPAALAWKAFIDDVANNHPDIISDCADVAIDQAALGNDFDQQDCIVELLGGAMMADVIDDQAAIWEADLQTTGVVACGDRTNKQCVLTHGANELLSRKTSDYAFACCVQGESWEPVTGLVADGTTCLGTGNYKEAFDVCAAIPDGRLCSKQEVLDLVLKDSLGSEHCDLDTELVWTSNLPSGKLETWQWKVCGTKNGCGNKGIGGLVNASDTSEKAFVRCCSGHNVPGFIGPKCGNIWAESDFGANGGCSGEMTYESAVTFCLSKGGYLCSKEDLQNDCTQGSGCGYDFQHVWAMDMGLVEIPLEDSGTDPYAVLDQSQKRWLACGDKTAPDCVKSEGAYEVVAAEPEMHEVRCCRESSTDLSAEGWITNGGACTNIWAMSNISTYGDGCVHEATYASAEGYCNSVGGVVCEKQWVIDGCTRGSGCSHDKDLVWTSAIVNETTISPVPMAWVTCGAKDRCTEHFGKGAKLSPLNMTNEVRCCSDDFKPNWQYNENKGCDVWGESDLPICYHAETFESAKKICELQGARLCTKNELLSDCTQGSGCGHDMDFVWSATKGWDVPYVPEPDTRLTDDKYYVACGDVDSEDCVKYEGTNSYLAPETAEHEFVCCSDTDLGDSWLVEDSDSCNVFASSDCFEPKTHADASSACATAGGRLCTPEEVLGRCVATAAKSCGFDDHLLWTSEGHDESFQGSLETLTWLTCGRRDKCTELHGAAARMEDPLEGNVHELRCCSDEPLAGWRQEVGCSVWAQSNFTDVGCSGAITYAEAEIKCSAVGGRLCEKSELVNNCAISTGCDYDVEMIWTKTPAFLPPAEQITEKKVWLACANEDNNKCVKDEGASTVIASSLSKQEVRCCMESDSEVPGWWHNDNGKCNGVYAKSALPVCYNAATFEEAKQICSKYDNGRLCSKQEVIDGCADHSECSFNTDLIWTEDEVDDATALVEKKWTVCGRSSGNCKGTDTKPAAALVAPTTVAAVRCCSSSYVPGWLNFDDCPAVWTASEFPTSNDCVVAASWTEAANKCSQQGGRLCTKAEILDDCARSTGCGHDHRMLWALDSGYEIA
mmetsp:Transcript_30566/g.71584  ORF Transcript_30566/g.71584 Transcript_30566/m.71584 type:complete len:1742 (-) Transcript_30566:198-5423(-)